MMRVDKAILLKEDLAEYLGYRVNYAYEARMGECLYFVVPNESEYTYVTIDSDKDTVYDVRGEAEMILQGLERP